MARAERLDDPSVPNSRGVAVASRRSFWNYLGSPERESICRQDGFAFAESSATARRAASVSPPSVCVCCFAHSMIFSAAHLQSWSTPALVYFADELVQLSKPVHGNNYHAQIERRH